MNKKQLEKTRSVQDWLLMKEEKVLPPPPTKSASPMIASSPAKSPPPAKSPSPTKALPREERKVISPSSTANDADVPDTPKPESAERRSSVSAP